MSSSDEQTFVLDCCVASVALDLVSSFSWLMPEWNHSVRVLIWTWTPHLSSLVHVSRRSRRVRDKQRDDWTVLTSSSAACSSSSSLVNSWALARLSTAIAKKTFSRVSTQWCARRSKKVDETIAYSCRIAREWWNRGNRSCLFHWHHPVRWSRCTWFRSSLHPLGSEHETPHDDHPSESTDCLLERR